MQAARKIAYNLARSRNVAYMPSQANMLLGINQAGGVP